MIPKSESRFSKKIMLKRKIQTGGLVARAPYPVKCASHCTQGRSQMRQKSRISFASAKSVRRLCRDNTQNLLRRVCAVHAAFISLNAD
jgi:hypothetical protein